MQGNDLLEMPYSDRQLVVVTDDLLAGRTSEEEAKYRNAEGIDWKAVGEAVLRGALRATPVGAVAVVAGEVTIEAIRAFARARESGVKVLTVGKSLAQQLRFPPGHPRDGVLYIGHPAITDIYYTMADFHRLTFEHKFCEAVELLMSLGAQEISVQHVRGWSREFSSRLSAPLGTVPESSVSAEMGGKGSGSDSLLYEATFSGTHEPSIPEGCVWYSHEPTWQAIAKGRLRYGLDRFSLSVTYDDDFGVNAGLKAKISKAGLELGGKFEDHQSTSWRISGHF